MGGNISLILGYAMHISYKVLIWTSSTKYLDIWSHQRQHHFRCFTNTLLMEGHHLFHGNNCTCETVPANVAELWPFVAQFCTWRSCHFLHHISIFVHMLSCCDEIDIISRAFFNWTVSRLALPSCGVPWSNLERAEVRFSTILLRTPYNLRRKTGKRKKEIVSCNF